MEVNIESKLEFGDFETNFSFECATDCVEFPPSWLLESLNEFQLSFSVPSMCNGLASTKENEKAVRACDKAKRHENSHIAKAKATQTFEFGSGEQGQKSSYINQKSSHKPHGKSTPEVSNPTSEKYCDESLEIKKNEEVFEEVGNGKVTESKGKELNSSVSSQESIEKDVKVALPMNGEKEENVKTSNQSKSQNSWAGLFRGKENAVHSKMVILNGHQENPKLSESKDITAESAVNGESHNTVALSANKSKGNSSSGLHVVKPENDKNAMHLAEMISKLELKFKPQAFIPRGLINSSNWCYINATLQALLMCPPFYQLLKTLPLNKKSTFTSTPTIDCFVKLASEFHPLSTKKGYHPGREVRQGPPFTPECVYDMLTATKSSLSDTGSQEDAEEFLSCVLNGLHEEMVKLSQFIHPEGDTVVSKEHNDAGNESQDLAGGNSGESDGDEWEEVITTKRNKSAVTRRADTSTTPISKIFRGELCTSVFRPGQKLSISHEPFYCLPLAVPADLGFWSVEDAMYALTNKENVTSSNVDQSVSRQQVIETLPPILILHLKRFVYNKDGGSKKIDRKMDFKSDLIIPKDILSKSSKKYTHAQRTYKLFAVVCHHGERATGGHYTADVFHIGMSSWLRIDDQNIQTVSHNDVTRHNVNRAPYLLFYRRTDLG